MEGIFIVHRAPRAQGKRGPRRYWTGFTALLFVVLLSVFTWVVHRRLSQYESLEQTGGHHMTATKVCLTDRHQSLAPLTQEIGGAALFVTVIALAGALLGRDNPKGLHSVDEQPRQFRCTRSKPCLSHFFFLPPPLSHISL